MRIKAHWLAASILSVLALSAPAFAADKAQATLKDADGKEVGHATLFGTTGGVLISLDLTAVPAGERAFHIHAVGKCEPPKFESAGPHFNPEQHSHGVMNPKGPHAGDMPNLHVPESGTLQIEVLNATVALSEVFAARRRRLRHRHSCRARRLQDRPRGQRRRPHRLRRHHALASAPASVPVMERWPAVLRGSRCALAPQDNGRPSNHGQSAAAGAVWAAI